jgi:hypothetical protein
MFRLTKEEADFWLRSRSQIAILKCGKNIKYLPSAFTEHGAIMAAKRSEDLAENHIEITICDLKGQGDLG